MKGLCIKLVPTPSQSRMATDDTVLRLLLTLHWAEGGADAISRTIDTSRVRGIGTRLPAPYFSLHLAGPPYRLCTPKFNCGMRSVFLGLLTAKPVL